MPAAMASEARVRVKWPVTGTRPSTRNSIVRSVSIGSPWYSFSPSTPAATETTTASGRDVRVPIFLELGLRDGFGTPEPDFAAAVGAFQAMLALGRDRVTRIDVEQLEESGQLVPFTLEGVQRVVLLGAPPGIGSLAVLAAGLAVLIWRTRAQAIEAMVDAVLRDGAARPAVNE